MILMHPLKDGEWMTLAKWPLDRHPAMMLVHGKIGSLSHLLTRSRRVARCTCSISARGRIGKSAACAWWMSLGMEMES